MEGAYRRVLELECPRKKIQKPFPRVRRRCRKSVGYIEGFKDFLKEHGTTDHTHERIALKKYCYTAGQL